ncbi:MAG: hypothetical protein ABSD28_00900 [Tepidisphaeraceae bacterium]|jgi:hypothetical protein
MRKIEKISAAEKGLGVVGALTAGLCFRFSTIARTIAAIPAQIGSDNFVQAAMSMASSELLLAV